MPLLVHAQSAHSQATGTGGMVAIVGPIFLDFWRILLVVLLLGALPYATLTELLGTQPTHISLEPSSQEEKDYAI